MVKTIGVSDIFLFEIIVNVLANKFEKWLRTPTIGMYIIRGVTSTNNSGRFLADKKSTRHRALVKFSIHHYRKQHPIWRLP